MSKRTLVLAWLFVSMEFLFAGGVPQLGPSPLAPFPEEPVMEIPILEPVAPEALPFTLGNCDTLWFQDGAFEAVNLVKVTPESVTYVPCAGGPTYSLSIQRIQSIHYASGAVQEFGATGGSGSQGSGGGMTASSSQDFLRKKADRKSWAAFGLGLGGLFIPYLGLIASIIAIALWLSARIYYKAKGRTTAASFGLVGFIIGMVELFAYLLIVALVLAFLL